jgi:hypothetical protein
LLGHQHPDDEWFIANNIPLTEKYEWKRDPLTDEILEPIYQTKTTRAPAQLAVKLLTGLIPAVFGESVRHDVVARGHVVHVVEPQKFQKLPEATDAVDATFTEVEGQPRALPPPDDVPERADIQELRAKAAALLRDGPRNPTPTAPVDTGAGKAVAGDPVERRKGEATLNDPNLYQPQPRQPQPSCARKAVNDPSAFRTDPKGGNLRSVIK